jgi:hypothetical protein
MAKEKMTLDELLARQDSGGNLATVESITDDPDNVKITPWRQDGGCLCHLALTVPKNTIESVEPTDQRHFCCNKVLYVVELQFKKGGSIALNDLFRQVANRASDEPKVPHRPFDLGSVPQQPNFTGYTSLFPATPIGQSPIARSVPMIADLDLASELRVRSANPNCYNDCFGGCFWPCYNACPFPGLACISNCQSVCQSVCNSKCRITCGPCEIDASWNSTQICSQGGNSWRQRCCIPRPCKPDPFGICSTGYCEECCTYINYGNHATVLCGISSCVP